MKVIYKGKIKFVSQGITFTPSDTEIDVPDEIGKYLISTFGDKFDGVIIEIPKEDKAKPSAKSKPSKED